MAEQAEGSGPERIDLPTELVTSFFDTLGSTPRDQFHLLSQPNCEPSDLISSRDPGLAVAESEMMALLGGSGGCQNVDERWESDRRRLEKWSFATKVTIVAMVAIAIAVPLVIFENEWPLAGATGQQVVVPKQKATMTAPAITSQSEEILLASEEPNRPRDPMFGLNSGPTPNDIAADNKLVGQGQNPPPQALAAMQSPARLINKEELANGQVPTDLNSISQSQNPPPQALAATQSPARVIDKEELAIGQAPTDPNSVSRVESLPPQALPATQRPVRLIDKEELATLLKRGRYLLSIGDIAPARLLLERAADADDASAAFDLAETYDPAVLNRSRVLGIIPDLAMARMWYERALKLGYSEARQRLAQMQK